MVSKKIKSVPSRYVVIGIVVTVLVLAIIPSYYYYNQYQKSQKLLQNPSLAAEEQIKTLLHDVGQLMELPKEQPTIATVTDVGKLTNQPFFQKARNGDKVLIYTTARKAILYDPNLKKIVEVGPVNIGNVTVTPTPAAFRLALYNGTSIAGYTSTVEKQLREKDPNLVITEKTNAAKATYTKTLVVDLTGKQKDLAAQVATFLQGEVGDIPSGETKPANADLLIILGK